MQFFYSAVFTVFVLVKYLVPTWTILCVFRPLEEGCGPHNPENALSSPSYDATCPSPVNQPPIKGCHAYRRMVLPENSRSGDMCDGVLNDHPHQQSAFFNPPLMSDDVDGVPPVCKAVRGLSTISEEASPSIVEGIPRPGGEKIMLISNGAEVSWQNQSDKC
ncbi:hypothetical protein J437_LFUL005146 [Ladona fulva]|uniref:Uncharacterized protein n=1 Tax=Ladona fulva TaxID=123851 RepID=A0A8K0KHU1_LADFU|nr:hypothetical protein J437_LFUL005146 [Ladona fulva]